MMINILVRTCYRPKAFKRMLKSIQKQSYKNIRMIVSLDDERALAYIPENIEKIFVERNGELKYGYDNYCNDLKNLVTDGYFFFLDDSDELIGSNAILKLSEQLKNQNGVICQFQRKNRLKPSNELIDARIISQGNIGMPCLVLRHNYKNIANLDGSTNAADFRWIKEVSEKVDLKFIKLPLVNAYERNHGKSEE